MNKDSSQEKIEIKKQQPTDWANYISWLRKSVWQDANTDKCLQELHAEWSR